LLGKNKPERILFLTDSIDAKSGYAHQTERLIRGFKGQYKVGIIGGNAVYLHHKFYSKPVLERRYDYNENVVIYPVQNYGSKAEVREIFTHFKPDVFILIPDFRFFEKEILYDDIVYRKECITLAWHIWDNEPPPTFNFPKYISFDGIFAVTPLTFRLVNEVCKLLEDDLLATKQHLPVVKFIPETIDTNQYRPLLKFDEKLVKVREHVEKIAGKSDLIILTIAVAARRKMLPTLMSAVDKFANINEDKNITLLLHTTKQMMPGQTMIIPLLQHNKGMYGFMNENANKELSHFTNLITTFMEDDYGDDYINVLYNLADVTINVSNAEGFGLPIIESMSAGTPVIAPDTGGVKEFIKEYSEMHNKISTGFLLPIRARELLSSPIVPYIYADYINEKDIINALGMIYKIKKLGEQYKKMSEFCRKVAHQYDYREIAPKFEKEMIKLYQNTPKKRKLNILNLTKIAKQKGL